MRNCTLTGNQLFQDILSYNLSLIGCSESSVDEDVTIATGVLSACSLSTHCSVLSSDSGLFFTYISVWVAETYMKKLFGTNKDRMGIDQKAVLLVSKVNESKRHGWWRFLLVCLQSSRQYFTDRSLPVVFAVPPFTTRKDLRRWRPKPLVQSGTGPVDDGEDDATAENITAGTQGEDIRWAGLDLVQVSEQTQGR